MTGHNYPKKYQIAGVAGDVWHGNEHTIYEATWFIEKDGEHYYCPRPRKSWKESDLKMISPMDRDYIVWFDKDEYVGINEGENLYLAGNSLVTDMEELIHRDLIDFSLHAWHPVGKGHYFANVMTPAAYDAFIQSLLTQLWDIVKTYFRSGHKVPEVHAEKAFKAYTSLYHEGRSSREKALNGGAYYLATGNTRQFKMESLFATIDDNSPFTDEKEFRFEAEENLKNLRQG